MECDIRQVSLCLSLTVDFLLKEILENREGLCTSENIWRSFKATRGNKEIKKDVVK